jgi:hypothetical protein
MPTTPPGSRNASATTKREGATAEVVAAYCGCMNDKMLSSETLSIHRMGAEASYGNGGVRQGIRLEVIFTTARTEPIEQAWSGRTLSSLRSCGLRGVGNRPCRSPVAFPRAARRTICHAREREHPEYHDATRLAARRRLRRLRDLRRRFVVSPRLDARSRGMTRVGLARRDAAVVSRRRLRDRPPARLVGKATSRRPELVHDTGGTGARIASAREGGTTMKLGICIAILFLALAGGVASAITAQLLPAHADPCGGYSCETAGVSDDFRRGS